MKSHSHSSHIKKNHQHIDQSNQLQTYLAQTYQLSSQLKKTKDQLIHLTLEHKQTLEKLNNSLKKQLEMQETIKKFADQSKVQQQKYLILEQQFYCLQAEYKTLFDKIYTTKASTFSDILLRENQMVIQLSDMKSQNSKNAAHFYQQVINTKNLNLEALRKENQNLQYKLSENSQFYRKKLDQISEENFELKTKLIKAEKIKMLITSTKIKENQRYQKQQYQIEIENLQEKMNVLQKLNHSLISRNNKLNTQNIKMMKQVTQLRKSLTKDQKRQWNFQFGQFQQLLKQNRQLKNLINNQNNTQGEQNQDEPNNLRKKESKNLIKIKEYQMKIYLLQNELAQTQRQLKKVRQLKQDDDHRNTLLMKRWNDIFIRMNPYFDIYNYTDLNLDQRQWIFFDKNKDYKTLKQYENKNFSLQKKISDLENKLKSIQNHHKVQISTKSTIIESYQCENQKLQSEAQNLSHLNNVLTDRLRQLQEQTQVYNSKKNKNKKVHKSAQLNKSSDQQDDNESDQNSESSSSKSLSSQNDQKISQINLFHNEVTIDLLKQLIAKQQAQKVQLLNVLKERDLAIIQLQIQLTSLIQQNKVEVLRPNYNNSINTPSTSTIELYQTLPNTIIQNMQDNQMKILQTIKKQEQKILDLHQSYKKQITSIENYYQNKIQQISFSIYKWQKFYQNLYTEFSLMKLQVNCKQNRINCQQEKEALNMHHSQIEIPHIQRLNSNNMIFEHQEQEVQGFIQENNPKIIGQSTVHNLAATLKNYQNQNTKTLETIIKIRQEYQNMKNKVKKVDQLIKVNQELIEELKIEKDKNSIQKEEFERIQNLKISLQNKLESKQFQLGELKQSVSAKQIAQLMKKNQQLDSHNKILCNQFAKFKQQVLERNQIEKISEKKDNSAMSSDQYQLIFSLYSKKNKQYFNEVQKNKELQEKLKNLQKSLVDLQKNQNSKLRNMDQVQIEQYRIMKEIFTNNNLFSTLKKANQIIIQKDALCKSLKQKIEQQSISKRKQFEHIQEQEQKLNE